MNNAEDFYNKKISELNSSLVKNRQRRAVFVAIKLATFITFAITLYHSFTDLPYIYPILSLLTYLIALYLDAKLGTKQRILKELIKSYLGELAYLKGDLLHLDNGDRFISIDHDYSVDLDLFGNNSLFQEMNRAATPNGANILANHLENPCLDAKTILNRQSAIEELSQHIEWTHNFRVMGHIHSLSDYNEDAIGRWKGIKYAIDNKIKPMLYTLNVFCIASLLSAILGSSSIAIFLIIALVQLLIFGCTAGYVSKIHGQLNVVLKSISNYFYLIENISNIDFSSPDLKRLQNILCGEKSSLIAFKELKNIQNSLDQRGNILALITLNALYLKDIHSVLKFTNWRDKYANNINEWVEAVSEIDALIGMANYKYNHSDFIFPKISTQNIVVATEITHPLMRGDNIVTNDFAVGNIHDIYIVTGANMSGKSTFLRSVGLNMVLALSGNVVRSKTFEFTPIELFTSMRTTDNLSHGRSYFHAELLRLKALHEKAKDGVPIFVILDEMLKGTNSEDKLNGSLMFLIKLLQLNISGIVATHDLALGNLSHDYPNNFHNICFEIGHSEEDIVYNYRLQEGVSKNMNASFLLKNMNLI